MLDFDATLSPPALAGPVWAGDAFVSGTCTAPAGSMVTLYRNGTPVGTAAVQPDGTYVVTPSAAPGAGDVLTASVHVALVESAPSTPLTVAEGTLGFSGPAAGALLNRVDDANLALSGYQTSATGTGKPGAAIVVTDASGNVLGAGVVGADGTYSVTITLVPGATSDLTATQTDAAGNTLAATHPDVGFDPRPNLLRSDRITSLSPVTPALATFLVQGQPSLAIWGPDGLAGRGEGAGTTANGSSDDDDFYVASLDAGAYDPDTSVASDGARPLVFYQLDLPGDALRVTKEKDAGGVLRVKLSY